MCVRDFLTSPRTLKIQTWRGYSKTVHFTDLDMFIVCIPTVYYQVLLKSFLFYIYFSFLSLITTFSKNMDLMESFAQETMDFYQRQL